MEHLFLIQNIGTFLKNNNFTKKDKHIFVENIKEKLDNDNTWQHWLFFSTATGLLLGMNGLKKVREEGNLKYDDEIKCPECGPGGQTREEDKLTSHIDEEPQYKSCIS